MTASNSAIKQKETELNSLLKSTATQLAIHVLELKASHLRLSTEVATKLADMKAQGLATDMPAFEKLLGQKTSQATAIAAVEQRSGERTECVEQRRKLRTDLKVAREEMTKRRKQQLANINQCLGSVIKDYTIFLRYDDAGITDKFEHYMQKEMEGTYLSDSSIREFCSKLAPWELADLVLDREYDKISKKTGISRDWAEKIVNKLVYWRQVFELQELSKPPKPIITVRTKSNPPKEIPVLQLSDGQRHTILLTIAMLADSNVPLVIDQPEDDLDNAFISSSIVSTLRYVKERRQVILVTHNANIAVLGDSELILPMYRENDCGMTRDRGSIDKGATKNRVVAILEGGPEAFMRRKEMYNH